MNISGKFADKKGFQSNNWLEKIVAILAIVNFALVLFDYTYIPCRDFYLQVLDGSKAFSLTQFYDPVKGIEPHSETEIYLEKFDSLKEKVSADRLDTDIPQVEEDILELRILSDRLIEDNSFAAIGKSGTLEKIKHELSDRVLKDTAPHIAWALPIRVGQNSAYDTFNTFWSQTYLTEAGWQQEINFFDREIKPLIQTNYYRDLGRFGRFVDRFWLIDLPFTIVFALDILIRTFNTYRRVPRLSLGEALLRRWYDLFLILPFWRLLRIIPVTIRLYQANLLNLKPLRKQLNYSFLLGFIDEIAELIGVNAVDRLQESIKTGEVAHRLLHPEHRSYVQVNNRNEVKAIASRIVKIGVHDVLPQVKPDFETLLHYAIVSTLERSPVYRRLENIPGFDRFPAQLSEQLAKDFSQTAYSNIVKGFDDPIIAKLSDRLLTNFRDALELELQKKHNLQDMESWLVDLLEEIKINYVEKIAQGRFDETIDEADRIHKDAIGF